MCSGSKTGTLWLKNIAHSQPKLTENKGAFRITLNENGLTLFENSSKTSAMAHISENINQSGIPTASSSGLQFMASIKVRVWVSSAPCIHDPKHHQLVSGESVAADFNG
jgi:hypothetical protein